MAAEAKRARAPHTPAVKQDCGPYYDDGDMGIFADGEEEGHEAGYLLPGGEPGAGTPNVISPPTSPHSVPTTRI